MDTHIKVVMTKNPFISVIVPVFNGSQFIGQCLDALSATHYSSHEVIVVDDASTDDSVEICCQKGATVLQLKQQSGPAAARNHGSKHARGEILLFIDADVVVHQDTIERVAHDFVERPDIAAVFGSYDDTPAVKDFVSQYKNLMHHYVHQQSNPDACTFWAGCGAVRREIFLNVGGFNQEKYPKPSIEDIELGFRLRKNGYKILLDKKLQVKHLKKWSLLNLLRTDIFNRAVPWSNLIMQGRERVNDLNLRASDKICAALVGLIVGVLPLSLFNTQLLYFIPLFLAIIFILQRRLYTFFLNRRGRTFLALAFPMHLLYYFYSAVTYMLCWVQCLISGKMRSVPEQP